MIWKVNARFLHLSPVTSHSKQPPVSCFHNKRVLAPLFWFTHRLQLSSR